MLIVRAKNALFLQYFYTRFMLVIIVIFRFLFDFILFCRYWIIMVKIWEKDKNVGNSGPHYSNPTQSLSPLSCLAQREEEKKSKTPQPHVPCSCLLSPHFSFSLLSGTRRTLHLLHLHFTPSLSSSSLVSLSSSSHPQQPWHIHHHHLHPHSATYATPAQSHVRHPPQPLNRRWRREVDQL